MVLKIFTLIFIICLIPIQNTGIVNKSIFIDSNDSIFVITDKARKAGLIRPTSFLITAFVYKNFYKIKTGEFFVAKDCTIFDVFKKIKKGDVVIRKLTIPEGFSVFQVKQRLNSNKYLKGNVIDQDFMILPDTYNYSYGTKRQDILNSMKNHFSKSINKLLIQYKLPKILNNKDELIILASIVEKETSIPDERPLIASVFLNRLNRGMKLQSDPTVIFAITNGEKIIKLSKKDLKFPSPFNTYYIKGLPPKPICCPGIESIKSILNPTKSDYLYFVADGKGGHSFSFTYKEHLKNIKKWKILNLSVMTTQDKSVKVD